MEVTTKQAARLLGGEMAGRNHVLCPGPGHSRKDRSLSVTFTGNGFLAHSFAGDDFRACRDHVKAMLGLADERRPIPFNDNLPSVDVAALADERVRILRGMRIWSEAIPIAGTLAEKYLVSRGLAYVGEALRFHPSCPFRQERHPAMVALMTDAATGEHRGVHRTALLPDGSGKAEPGKMMLGAAKGAVVRLTPDEDVSAALALAEGIETALATGFQPIWACMTAGNVRDFPVLSGVDHLSIWADADVAGVDAANAAGERWHAAGREVVITTPNAPGFDFADRIAA